MDKRLNIVFIPPKEIADYAAGLCLKIKEGSEISFLLDGINNFPHITIYQLVVPENNMERLVGKLDKITQNSNPQTFIFTDFQEHSGFLGAGFTPTDSIKAVQKEVVDSISDLREGNIVSLDDPNLLDKPDQYKQIITEFGFDNLFDFYNPHITITRLPDFEKARKLAKQLTWPFSEFESSSIGLYSLGEFGTCNKLIKEFKLKAVS